ncbi:hypothetical protein BGZ76_003629 [Entomortierella beljakovae]|nr:hypothetical protein BGZ76_003629 [Entomortierella beljakovae]
MRDIGTEKAYGDRADEFVDEFVDEFCLKQYSATYGIVENLMVQLAVSNVVAMQSLVLLHKRKRFTAPAPALSLFRHVIQKLQSQSSGPTKFSLIAQSPAGPQPGSQAGNDPSATIPYGGDTPTKTQSSNNNRPSATSGSGDSTPQAQAVTTVTVINGTTTTIVASATVPQPQPQQQPVITTSSLPKASQSVIVIQSVTYGKVLPAAGPTDDQISGHFWDQLVPASDGTKAASSTRIQTSYISFLCTIVYGIWVAADLI